MKDQRWSWVDWIADALLSAEIDRLTLLTEGEKNV